jgi:Mce-associated membrane protein
MTTERSDTSVQTDETRTGEESDIKGYDVETSDDADGAVTDAEQRPSKWLRTKHILVFWIFPVLALILATGSGYLKWQGDSDREAQAAQVQAVQAATENTIAILSYQPDNVDKQLNGARDRLAEPFKDQYTKLISDVVIPGSKQKKISAVATVPAAAPMSATTNHAVVLVFIDQSIVIGTDAPTTTSSTVRVTLDKDGDRWLTSQFEPV